MLIGALVIVLLVPGLGFLFLIMIQALRGKADDPAQTPPRNDRF